ncbi:hypothetical protein F5972_08475 [Microbispora cellulosiformans]|uniref:Uncharacterized protein n=1 Tax=Microbispora cellulosiformans TaxID=2614688 RepID=A0A5J5K5W1_9ACTN|nr:hypothetical protein [Microbispora cellulosiformans]KAA9379677.1 hypothetical protein F5972_08475 [Microbispora cellulosiformans]
MKEVVLMSRPSAPHAQQQLRQLLDDAYGGDPVAALLDLADIGDLAVAYLNRDWFADYLHRAHGLQLTPEQWRDISSHLDDFHDHVRAYGQPNITHEFAAEVCRMAGVLPADN